MARKKNAKGAQYVYPIQDATTASPPYETSFGTTNTDSEKKEYIELHSCKCPNKDKKKKVHRRQRSWQSVTNLYGDTDTTQIWDDELQKPKAVYKTNKQNQDPYFIDDTYQHNDFGDNIVTPTYKVKNKPAKISLLSLYRRHKHNKYKHRKEKNLNESSKEKYKSSVPHNKPNIEFKLTKKPGKKAVIDRYATGDMCREGSCREALEKLYKLYGFKYGTNDYEISKMRVKKKEGKKKERKKILFKKRDKKDETLEGSEKEERKKEGNKKKPGTKIEAKEKKGKKGQEKKKETKKRDIRKEKGETKSKSDNNKDTKYSKIVSKVKTAKGNTKSSLMRMVRETSKKLNIGEGDQNATLKNKDLKDVKPKVSFIDRMWRRTCKCKSENGPAFQTVLNANDQTGEPFFEMRVDSSNMHVMNSPEINDKIRKLGRSQRNLSCICPSRLNRLHFARERRCKRGICEKAFKNKHTNFDCKCVDLNNVVECRDSTCNLEPKTIKLNRKEKPPISAANADKSKPLFQVMLDSKNMNIINSKEIDHILKNAPANKVCSDGICKTVLNEKGVELNCRCIGNKLKSAVYDCDKNTCRNPEKKCILSNYCSRIFSKSDNLTHQKRRRRRALRQTDLRENNINMRSNTYYRRKGVMFNTPHDLENEQERMPYIGERLSNVLCKCFCECHVKKKRRSSGEKMKGNKKTKKRKRRKRRRKGFFRRKKRDDRTCSEIVLDNVEKRQENCEKNVNYKKKQYMKQEKKSIRENKIMDAAQIAASKKHHHNLNHITNFITGVLNVGIGFAKTAIKIPIWLFGDPIGSYIYIREKSRNPSAALTRIIYWFIRTWKNQNTTVAKRLHESSTMNVIADQIEDSAVYNAIFCPKDKNERAANERRNRMRKRRIQKREEEALYGCRHMFLTTMRKTPCLWFYHICPDLYPQCLGITSFMNNFFHILVFLCAVMVWTPCILTFEMCRACLCCFFCTH